MFAVCQFWSSWRRLRHTMNLKWLKVVPQTWLTLFKSLMKSTFIMIITLVSLLCEIFLEKEKTIFSRIRKIKSYVVMHINSWIYLRWIIRRSRCLIMSYLLISSLFEQSHNMLNWTHLGLLIKKGHILVFWWKQFFHMKLDALTKYIYFCQSTTFNVKI